jgi:peptide deformylase
MAYIREIITDGHPTLRKVAKKVDPADIADPMFQQLLDDMFETMYQGCLSVPGMVGDLTRFERVVCTGLDRNGKKISLEGTGLFGRCLQHEMDHLDGILYIDKAKNIRPAATDEEVEEVEAVASGAR